MILAVVQECIGELEEWKIDAGEVMLEILEQTCQMQETDLKGSTRRSNINNGYTGAMERCDGSGAGYKRGTSFLFY